MPEYRTWHLRAIIRHRLTDKTSAAQWLTVPGSHLWGLFVLSIFLQAAPMPQSILVWLSPNTLQDWVRTVTVAMHAGNSGNNAAPAIQSLCFSIAHDAHLALFECLRLLACTILFYLLLNLLKSKKQINLLVWLIIAWSMSKASGMLMLQAIISRIRAPPGFLKSA